MHLVSWKRTNSFGCFFLCARNTERNDERAESEESACVKVRVKESEKNREQASEIKRVRGVAFVALASCGGGNNSQPSILKILTYTH